MITNAWIVKNLSRLPAIKKEIAKMKADLKDRQLSLDKLMDEKDHLSKVTEVFEGVALVEHGFDINGVVGERHGDIYKTVNDNGYSGRRRPRFPQWDIDVLLNHPGRNGVHPQFHACARYVALRLCFNTVEELVDFCRKHGRCSFTAPGEKLEDQSRRWDGKETLIYFQNEYD